MELSYASGESATPLLGQTIGANLERTAARFADREALVSRHQALRYTYAQLDAEVDRLARGLLGLGLEKGDRLGIWSPNCAEWALIQYATAKVDVVLVNINRKSASKCPPSTSTNSLGCAVVSYAAVAHLRPQGSPRRAPIIQMEARRSEHGPGS